MSGKMTLREAFKKAPYRHSGHGISNIGILKDAFEQLDGSIESDVYGSGEVINRFEEKMADYLGKDTAVFFPSGTMAQQIALRIWCDEKGIKKVAYHPLCHLEIHEEDGLKELHQIDPMLLADKDRLITMEDVTAMDDDVSCLLLELPQREIGGQLPPFEELEAISAYCKENGIRLHLDGARLYEILPYYGKTAAEVCSLFDSVYVSFYKGIGGVAGAILAGPKTFTEKSKVWKRRHGGDLISLYPYVISADYYFEARKDKMAHYHESAMELAAFYNNCHGIQTMPGVPVSNMFHVHIDAPRDVIEPFLTDLYAETGLALTGYLKDADNGAMAYEVNLGDKYEEIPKSVLQETFRILDEKLQTVLTKKR